MEEVNTRRLGILEVTPQAIIACITQCTNFGELWPGADHTAIHYDFDSDCFWFKFCHPSLAVHEDGEKIPRVYPELKWKS